MRECDKVKAGVIRDDFRGLWQIINVLLLVATNWALRESTLHGMTEESCNASRIDGD